MKKAIFYSPYLDTLGGGERYFFSIAKYFSGQNYEITIPYKNISKNIEKRFAINIDNIKYKKELFKPLKNGHLKEKYQILKNYDFCFWVTDGSLPFMFAKTNWLHFQVPFRIGYKDPVSIAKTLLIDKIICNSNFTKKVVENSFLSKNKVKVIYPPVDIDANYIPKSKKNIILSVGRIDEPLNSKRQDVLIEAFENIHQQIPGWKLVFVGGVNSKKEVEELKIRAKNLPIEFKTNISFKKLKQIYKEASIYWHAAGYGADIVKHPKKAEHFGIAILEAMSFGCFPLVFNNGGPKEYIKNKANGYLWDKVEELEKKTVDLIKSGIKKEQLKKILLTPKRFDIEKFNKKIKEIYENKI